MRLIPAPQTKLRSYLDGKTQPSASNRCCSIASGVSGGGTAPPVVDDADVVVVVIDDDVVDNNDDDDDGVPATVAASISSLVEPIGVAAGST